MPGRSMNFNFNMHHTVQKKVHFSKVEKFCTNTKNIRIMLFFLPDSLFSLLKCTSSITYKLANSFPPIWSPASGGYVKGPAPIAHAARTFLHWINFWGASSDPQGPDQIGKSAFSPCWGTQWNTSIWCNRCSLPSVIMGSYCKNKWRGTWKLASQCCQL